MDDARSIINLTNACRFFRCIAQDPQKHSSIARNLAGKILDEHNSGGGVKLAFMVIAARSIDPESPEQIKAFLDTYAHHNEQPPELYRLSAVMSIESMHEDVCQLLHWMKVNGLIWPLMETGRKFSATELARQKRACYTLEIAFRLFRSRKIWTCAESNEHGEFLPVEPALSEHFWGIFSGQEAHICLTILNHLLAAAVVSM